MFLWNVEDIPFHIPPTKADFSELPHLGKLDSSVRNPKTSLALNQAKTLLQLYTGISEMEQPPSNTRKGHRPYEKPVFKKLGERYTKKLDYSAFFY